MNPDIILQNQAVLESTLLQMGCDFAIQNKKLVQLEHELNKRIAVCEELVTELKDLLGNVEDIEIE